MGLFKNKGQGLDKVLKFASKVTSGMPIVGAVVSAAEKLVPDEGFGGGAGAAALGSTKMGGALKGLFGGAKSGGQAVNQNASSTKAAGVAADGAAAPATTQWNAFSTWPMWAKVGAFVVPGGLLLILLMPKKHKTRYGR
jgi:hypothetical protein